MRGATSLLSQSGLANLERACESHLVVSGNLDCRGVEGGDSLETLGITYLVGKIKFKLFISGSIG